MAHSSLWPLLLLLLLSPISLLAFGLMLAPDYGRQTSSGSSLGDDLLGEQGFVGLESEALSSLLAWGG